MASLFASCLVSHCMHHNLSRECFHRNVLAKQRKKALARFGNWLCAKDASIRSQRFSFRMERSAIRAEVKTSPKFEFPSFRNRACRHKRKGFSFFQLNHECLDLAIKRSLTHVEVQDSPLDICLNLKPL